MSIPATCSRCDAKTWIIFDAKPWCREHFMTATTPRTDPPIGGPVSQRG